MIRRYRTAALRFFQAVRGGTGQRHCGFSRLYDVKVPNYNKLLQDDPLPNEQIAAAIFRCAASLIKVNDAAAPIQRTAGSSPISSNGVMTS